jgi:hypothetical protein
MVSFCAMMGGAGPGMLIVETVAQIRGRCRPVPAQPWPQRQEFGRRCAAHQHSTPLTRREIEAIVDYILATFVGK